MGKGSSPFSPTNIQYARASRLREMIPRVDVLDTQKSAQFLPLSLKIPLCSSGK